LQLTLLLLLLLLIILLGAKNKSTFRTQYYAVSFDAEDSNMALGKTATATSTEGSNYASLALDGNIMTSFRSEISTEDLIWSVSLGARYQIYNIIINYVAGMEAASNKSIFKWCFPVVSIVAAAITSNNNS